jgi:hypothetical protein
VGIPYLRSDLVHRPNLWSRGATLYGAVLVSTSLLEAPVWPAAVLTYAVASSVGIYYYIRKARYE